MSNGDNELALVDELIKKGESPTVDFKRRDILSNPIKIATLMTAFANSSGGRILIGVCDDGSIEGMTAEKGHEELVMNVARDRCDPPLTPKFSTIKKDEGDIYVVKVLRYRAFPHAVRTKEGRVYFVRVGTTVRETISSELALLFESAKEEIMKKPKLELLLLDSEGNPTKHIHAQPTYIKIKKVKTKSALHAMTGLPKIFETSLYPLTSKKPSKDLVPIGIEVSNIGEAPAHGIRIFLKFPSDCELVPRSDAVGGFYLLERAISKREPTSGGLYIDSEDKSEAVAWINTLSNDLTMKRFDRVYVKFPAKKGEYEIKAQITQHNFPPEDLEFRIIVEPNFKQEIEYVYEKPTPEDMDEKELERRIKELKKISEKDMKSIR